MSEQSNEKKTFYLTPAWRHYSSHLWANKCAHKWPSVIQFYFSKLNLKWGRLGGFRLVVQASVLILVLI